MPGVIKEFGSVSADAQAFVRVAELVRGQEGIPIAHLLKSKWLTEQLEKVLC